MLVSYTMIIWLGLRVSVQRQRREGGMNAFSGIAETIELGISLLNISIVLLLSLEVQQPTKLLAYKPEDM